MNKSINLVINASPLHNQSAGVHVWTREFCKALHRIDSPVKVTLIVEQPTDDFPKYDIVHLPTFKWLPGYATFRYFLFFPLLALWKKADYFLEPAHFGPFNLPLFIKRLTVIHDLTPVLFPQWHTFNSWFLQKLLLPTILKKTQHIIAVSNNTRKDLCQYLPAVESKVKVIYPGIDHIAPIPDATDGSGQQEVPYILYVGTLEPRKNVSTLIRAFDQLKEETAFGDYQLWLVGQRGWKNEKFDLALQESNHVKDIKILGFVSNTQLVKAYKKCQLFVYPSLYEGFGFPVLEALQHGAKVVTSNNSSLQEIAKGYAFLVDEPANPLALAKGIKKAIQDNFQPSEPLEKWLSRFRWRKTAENIVAVLENQKA